jgi:hypothetical protein
MIEIKTMKTRVGKIARLPKQIRDELNRRLDDGIPGVDLVRWLNTLPEVQKILVERFGGRPLNNQNLTEWRRGGYAEWAGSRNGQTQWQDLLERGQALTQKRSSQNDTDVSSYLGTFLVVELAEALDQLHTMKNSDERWKLMSVISRVLSNLRNDDTREKRLRLWNCKEARRNAQFKTIQAQSNLKKIIFQSQPPAARNSKG